MSGPFALLPWDSEFFGTTIARVTAPRLTPALGAELQQWAADRSVACVYFLADPCDAETFRLAQELGFRLVDLRVTLRAGIDNRVPAARDDRIREAVPGDVPALEAIARTSHHDTRFYADRQFDPRRCDDMYAHWIAKSCRGDADIVFVAEHDGQPAGYMTGHIAPDGSGSIGLVAVGAAARGHGRGAALVSAVLDWFASRNVRRVTVVTQARNAAALALYQRSGFHVSRVDLWYHCWRVGAPHR